MYHSASNILANSASMPHYDTCWFASQHLTISRLQVYQYYNNNLCTAHGITEYQEKHLNYSTTTQYTQQIGSFVERFTIVGGALSNILWAVTYSCTK